MVNWLERKCLLGGLAAALVLGVPAFAAEVLRDDPARASQRIESARAALEAASQPEAAAAANQTPARDRYLQRASVELQSAQSDYEQGAYRGALHHALRAERLVWKASAPRKGDR